MKILKSYESFSGNTISFEEIKGIIDDILIDLKDINDNFSWKVVIQKKTGSTDNKYILDIFCHDAQALGIAPDVSKIKGWVEVLDHLFEVLISEDLKIYSLQDLYNREVKPGNINLKWVPKHIISPTTGEYEDTYWQKSFLIMTY
jgi:hypothetical protein